MKQINTIKLSTFEVAANDCSSEMNWKNAKEACLKLGQGWRLPTKVELEEIWNFKKQGGVIEISDWHWSSSMNVTDDSLAGLVWIQGFTTMNGSSEDHGLHEDISTCIFVRAVRSL